MRTFLLTLVCVFVFGASGLAQSGAPTSWTFRVYAAGASAPVSTLTVTAGQVNCNQSSIGVPLTGLPRWWVWEDPANAGRLCGFDDLARFTALADGNYTGTVSASNADGTLGESGPFPFVRRRPNPPAVPMGLRITS